MNHFSFKDKINSKGMLGHGHRLRMSLWRSVHRVDDVNQHLLAPFIDANYLVSQLFLSHPVFVIAKENRYSARAHFYMRVRNNR